MAANTSPGVVSTTLQPVLADAKDNDTTVPARLFLETAAAQGIAGIFTWLALIITGHQVRTLTTTQIVLATKSDFDSRFISIFAGILARPSKDGSFEYYSSFQSILSIPGSACSFSPRTSIFISIQFVTCTKV